MRAIILLPLILTGCGDMPQRWSEADVRGMARQEQEATNRILIERMNRIEADIADAKTAADIANAQAKYSELQTDKLRQTVNHNADVSNENNLDAMTRRGACGYKTIYKEQGDPAGTPLVRQEAIRCTQADLRK